MAKVKYEQKTGKTISLDKRDKSTYQAGKETSKAKDNTRKR